MRFAWARSPEAVEYAVQPPDLREARGMAMLLRSMPNLWNLPNPLPCVEVFETLAETSGCRVERIISTGQVTPPGTWLEQDWDEWVVLLKGEATLGFADQPGQRLVAGDHLLIPAGTRHRVEQTSQHPPCLWLAVHGRPGAAVR